MNPQLIKLFALMTDYTTTIVQTFCLALNQFSVIIIANKRFIELQHDSFSPLDDINKDNYSTMRLGLGSAQIFNKQY